MNHFLLLVQFEIDHYIVKMCNSNRVRDLVTFIIITIILEGKSWFSVNYNPFCINAN